MRSLLKTQKFFTRVDHQMNITMGVKMLHSKIKITLVVFVMEIYAIHMKVLWLKVILDNSSYNEFSH